MPIVVISSHSLAEVQRTADRAVVLRGGRVVARGTVEQLRGTAALSARPGATNAVGVGIAVAGYVVSALFPLREGWAPGGEPLTHDTDPWRYLTPLALAVALAAAGIVAFNHRDVHAP